MGNSPQGVCMSNKLGLEIVGDYPIQAPQQVISTYVLCPKPKQWSLNSQLFHILIVTNKRVELFCLLTGDRRLKPVLSKPSIEFTSSVHLPDSKQGNLLVVGDTSGILTVIEVYSLTCVGSLASNFSPSLLLKQNEQIQSLTKIDDDSVVSGHLNESIKIWNVSSAAISQEIPARGIPKTIKYSRRNSIMVVGFVRGETSIGLFSIAREDIRNISDFEGTCLSLEVIDMNNFVVALNNRNKLFVWDILTTSQLISMQLESGLITQCTSLVQVGVRENTTLILIGGSDGWFLISKLLFDSGSLNLLWQPLKKVRVGSFAINCLVYLQEIDAIAAGDNDSKIQIVPDILAMTDEVFGKTETDTDFKLEELRDKYPDKSVEELIQLMREEN